MPSLPLANARLVLLFLTFAAGTISFASNVNALVKGNQFVNTSIATAAKIGTTLYVDTSNIKIPGYVEGAAVGLLASTAFFALGFLILDMCSSPRKPLSTRTLPVQMIALAFFTIWTFACGVPKTMRIVNGEAKVAAFIGDFPVPDEIVRQTEKLEGFSRVYWVQSYLRFTAIAVWPAVFFAILALIVTVIANSKASNSSEPYIPDRTSGDDSEYSNDKQSSV